MKKYGLLPVFIFLISAQLCFASLDPVLFPVHQTYQANIEFWKKVFAEKTTTDAILHDKDDLSLIYKTIKLVDKSTPNARKINKKRISKAKEKVTATLRSLATGNRPATRKDKKIATLLGPDANPEDYRVAAKNLRVQYGIRDRFAQGIVRSGRYLKEMQAIFKDYDVPEVLTYLPHVESSFNPDAYSKYGAAGVWQFTWGTGKQFMNINHTVDERRDPILATHAAAKLLKKNYAELGSWPLAITAYNHGLAGMKRAKEKHGNYPKVFADYHSRTFKFASRNFYSEFIAAYQIASNYTRYFGKLPLHNPVQYQIINLPGYLPLQTLKDKLGLSKKTIYEQNPALRHPVLSGQKYIPRNYPLRLPQSVSVTRLKHLIPENLYYAKQKPSRYHRVRKGETVSRIAKIHGVRVKDIVLANNLSRKATIYPRQKLRIPPLRSSIN